MTYQLTFTIEAEKDLEVIQDYYDNISSLITDNFFEEFFYTTDFIEQDPDLF